MTMSGWTLYHGNKNYSSWSMRAWLALKLTGADFDEIFFHLGEPGVREKIRRHSPTGKVPALRHGDLVIWDSLAICEYLAERFPEASLWPPEAVARAVARSVSAEMHSGFQALRKQMPFNVRRSSPGKGRGEGVGEEIERILGIWTTCRSSFGGNGAFLFGGYCLADVMFAPVVSRFHTYAVELEGVAQAYAVSVWEHPHVRQWRAAAEAEPWLEPEYDL
jgi:glutathione S-transferase